MSLRIILPLILLITTQSCYNGENVDMKHLEGSWGKNAVQTFSYNVTDAKNPKNIIFVVRNNDSYPYANLRLIASIENTENRKATIDTLNYILAQPNGEWIGSGFGTTKETLFQYRLNYHFPGNGTYLIKVRQAMRQNVLKGIEDFGVKIETAKP